VCRVLYRDAAATEIYALSLRDALPISVPGVQLEVPPYIVNAPELPDGPVTIEAVATDNRGDSTRASVEVTLDSSCSQASDCGPRSEEHTSELQSRENLVCRLLLEKKKQ